MLRWTSVMFVFGLEESWSVVCRLSLTLKTAATTYCTYDKLNHHF